MTEIKDILDNIKEIYMTDSSLETLIDYERVLDRLDIYSFKNWELGELVKGPIYEKYFVTCSWMYPFRKMPDPSGAERLLNHGCEISFEKEKFTYPITVKSPDDFQPGTKYPRMVSKPVWLVTITMPKKLMGEIERGSLELENDIIDSEDIETAYEEGMDDEKEQKTDQSQETQAMQQGTQIGQQPPVPTI